MSKEPIVRRTLEELRETVGATDWDRLRAEQAAGIEPELDEEEIGIDWDWDNARLVRAPVKQAVAIRLDADVVAFFKAEGRGYQTRMNAVLRSYMLAKQGKSGK